MPTQIINLNDATPAAPTGGTNIHWQAAAPSLDPTVARDVSAYVLDPEPPFNFTGEDTDETVVTVKGSAPNSAATFVQGNPYITTNTGSGLVAFSSPVTLGNLILVVIYDPFGSLATMDITDNFANVYIPLSVPTSGELTVSGGAGSPLYVYGCIANLSGVLTFNITGPSGRGAMAFLEYQINTSDALVDVHQFQTFYAAPSTATQTVTTDESTLLLAIGGSYDINTYSALPTGYTERLNFFESIVEGSTTFTGGLAVLDAVESSAATYSAEWTLNTTGVFYPSMVLLAIKLGAVSGQTADLIDFEDYHGDVLSSVNAEGQFVLPSTAGSPTNTPAAGSLAFDSTAEEVKVYTSSGWVGVSGGGGGGAGSPMSFMGAWSSAASYSEGNVVSDAGSAYLCILGYTPSGASASLVQAAAAVNVTSVAFSSNVTGGNLLVLFFSAEGTVDPSTVSDSLGTVYTKAAAVTGEVNNAALYYGIAPSSGANTVSFTASGGWNKGSVAEFLGASATVDVSATAFTGATPNGLSITTSETDLICFGIGGYYSGESFTVSTGFTIAAYAVGHDSIALAYAPDALPGIYTPAFTLSGGTDDAPVIAVAFSLGTVGPNTDTSHWLKL